MIKTVLFVYGDGSQINRGEWSFDQLPRPGEIVVLWDERGLLNVRVRQVEHFPTRTGEKPKNQNSVFISADFIGVDDDPDL